MRWATAKRRSSSVTLIVPGVRPCCGPQATVLPLASHAAPHGLANSHRPLLARLCCFSTAATTVLSLCKVAPPTHAPLGSAARGSRGTTLQAMEGEAEVEA